MQFISGSSFVASQIVLLLLQKIEKVGLYSFIANELPFKFI